MSYKFENLNSLQQVCRDLTYFDEKTHKIVVRKTSGVYHPAIAPRSRGIKWFFEIFTGWIVTARVNRCMQQFILQNETNFQNSRVDTLPMLVNLINYDAISPEVKSLLDTIHKIKTNTINRLDAQRQDLRRLEAEQREAMVSMRRANLKIEHDARTAAHETTKTCMLTKERMMADAENKAHHIMVDAENNANRIIEEAQERANKLDAAHKAIIKNLGKFNDLGKSMRASPGDFRFICAKGQEVQAHKIVLQSFKDSLIPALLKRHFKEKDTFDLTQYSKETVELCMNLLYDSVPYEEISKKQLVDLIDLTDYLLLPEPSKHCMNALLQFLKTTKDNSFDILMQMLNREFALKTLPIEVKEKFLRDFDYNRFNELTPAQKGELSKMLQGEGLLANYQLVLVLRALCEDPHKILNSSVTMTLRAYRLFDRAQDEVKAYQLLHEAEKLGGSLDALPASFLVELGKEYLAGDIGKKNPEKALHYYTLALAKGSAEAATEIGNAYFDGKLGCKINIAQAYSYFREAVKLGGASEAFRAGKFFFKLSNTDLSTEGLSYLMMAATAKHQPAIIFLKEKGIQI